MTKRNHSIDPPLPPAERLAVILAYRGSELCGVSGKLQLTHDRAGRLALCFEITERLAAVGVAVMEFEAYLIDNEEIVNDETCC